MNDHYNSTPQFFDWSSPNYLKPLQKIPVHDKEILDVKWVEISPIESGNFGFQNQRVATINLNNPNGLIDIESIHGMVDVSVGTTSAYFTNGMDGVFQRETLQLQNGIVFENNLYANEVKYALDTLTRTTDDLNMDLDYCDKINTSVASRTALSGPAQTFNFQPRFSFGKLNGMYHSCKGGTIQVQLEFADDRVALQQASVATPKLTFANLRLFARYIDVSVKKRQEYLNSDIYYNYEGYAYMSNKWDGTSNNVALRVAGKSFRAGSDRVRCPCAGWRATAVDVRK